MSKHFHADWSNALPFLWTLAPGSKALSQAITTGNPGEGLAFASQVQDLGQQFGALAQQFGSQAGSSSGVWQGDAAEKMRSVGQLLSQAGLEHAGEVVKVGSAFERLVQDYQQWAHLTTTTQTMADHVCKMLVGLPFGAGIPAAHGYANMTTAWTGALVALAVKTTKDVMDLLHSIDGKSFEKAWKPPEQSSFTPSFS